VLNPDTGKTFVAFSPAVNYFAKKGVIVCSKFDRVLQLEVLPGFDQEPPLDMFLTVASCG
jgi:hypothetical protein